MKRKMMPLLLALAMVVSMLVMPASAAEPAKPGIYGIQSLAMSAVLKPQLADNSAIPGKSVTINGSNQTLYENAVRFELSFQGNPNAMYFVQVNKGDRQSPVSDNMAEAVLQNIPYVNQYQADSSGKVICSGKEAPYPNTLESGVYSVFVGNKKIARFSYYEPTVGTQVKGQITSYNANTPVKVELFAAGAAAPAYQTTVNGLSAAYTIEDVAPGTYTMKVSKATHVARSYQVVVASQPVTRNVTINPMGDVTLDGKVNGKDWTRLYDHVNEIDSLAEYAAQCADVILDGKVNGKDWTRLYDHVNEIDPFW